MKKVNRVRASFIFLPMLMLVGCSHTSTPDSSVKEENIKTVEVEENKMMEKKTASESSILNKSYTLEEITKHDNKLDCWMTIEGKVYDVTQTIADGKHPGGDAILLGCGKDATTLFNSRPKDGTPHSDKARGFLPNSLIGILAK